MKTISPAKLLGTERTVSLWTVEITRVVMFQTETLAPLLRVVVKGISGHPDSANKA